MGIFRWANEVTTKLHRKIVEGDDPKKKDAHNGQWRKGGGKEGK